MRALKISILIFILSITLSAQRENQNTVPNGNYSTSIPLLLEKIVYFYSANNWEDFQKYIYTYDNLKLVNELRQDKNGTNWENAVQYNYSYNMHLLSEEIRQTWNGFIWVNDFRTNNFYNSVFKKERIFRDQWDGYYWVKYDSAFITYNIYDSLEYMYWYAWVGVEWRNRNWQIFSYEVSGMLSELLNRIWVQSTSQWENEWRYIYEYNHSNQLETLIVQDWDVTHWNNKAKDSLKYDINYEFLLEKYKYWWINYSWEYFSKHNYSYNWYGLIQEDLELHWNGSEWINHRKTIYDWIIVGVNEENIKGNIFKLTQNYPNPFNPSTSLQYAIGSRQFVTLKVYDLLGREVASLVNEEKPAGEYEVEFNAANLLPKGSLTSGISARGGYASGIYFYQLKAGSFAETRKMVLIK